jgi:hypothetical protein
MVWISARSTETETIVSSRDDRHVTNKGRIAGHFGAQQSQMATVAMRPVRTASRAGRRLAASC